MVSVCNYIFFSSNDDDDDNYPIHNGAAVACFTSTRLGSVRFHFYSNSLDSMR